VCQSACNVINRIKVWCWLAHRYAHLYLALHIVRLQSIVHDTIEIAKTWSYWNFLDEYPLAMSRNGLKPHPMSSISISI
jgi:hypothetical protein